MNLNPPREVKFPLLFFKSLSGLGVGVIGMVVLLIFVMFGLGSTTANDHGPFLIFSAIAMGFVTSLVSNCLGVFVFGLLDRDKYNEVRMVLKRIITLNILIFIFLLPIYFFGNLGYGSGLKVIFLLAILQLVISAVASMLILELSNAKFLRENFIAVYGITFALMATIVVNVMLYQLGDSSLSPQEIAAGSSDRGATIVLFAVLPVTWFFFGLFTTATEMIYRWIWQTWGIDPLAKAENE